MRIITTISALVLLCFFPAAHAQAPAQEPVKIGWIGHLTGFLSAFGQDMLHAAELAVKEVNASGGVNGRNLQLVVRDDRGDPSQAVTLARELDKQEKVVALSGSLSADISKALRGYAEANQVPYISASSGESTLTMADSNWTHRIQPPAAVQGAAMAKFALSRKRDAKIAVVRHDILYYPEVMNGAIWYLKKSGHGQLVYNEYFPPRQHDFKVLAAQLKAANPDFVLFAFNPPGLANFIRAVRSVGFDSERLICFSIQTAQTQRSLGTDLVGMYTTTFFDESLRSIFPEAGKLSDRFFSVYGYYPPYFSAHSYSAVHMISQALKKSRSLSRPELVKVLRSTDLIDASGRKIRFDENGRSNMNSVYIIQAKEFDDKRLATFVLADTISFEITDVPDLELSKARM